MSKFHHVRIFCPWVIRLDAILPETIFYGSVAPNPDSVQIGILSATMITTYHYQRSQNDVINPIKHWEKNFHLRFSAFFHSWQTKNCHQFAPNSGIISRSRVSNKYCYCQTQAEGTSHRHANQTNQSDFTYNSSIWVRNISPPNYSIFN